MVPVTHPDEDDFDELYDDKSTVLHAKFDPSSQAPAAFRLFVLEGPEAGRAFELDGRDPSRALLGQSPACAVRLSDPSVSRRHAALDVMDGRLRIVDLGSKNGTTVDAVSVLDAYVQPGSVIRVGATALRVEALVPSRGGVLPLATNFGRIIGASTEMRRLYPLCERLAHSDVPVVIEGETGTGKEVLAEALHEQGPRADKPFVVFDCTAVPSNLVESELFGHERGAFTGAVTTRRGVFEEAHGGTLLIDEIGDLELALQPKLLRAIERREIRRVGGSGSIQVDVRILAATRRDLDREVQAGRFRDDLFHRLAVARIELPPLRFRRGDIPLLTRTFCKELGGEPRAISGELLLRWEDLPWPGNVRELRNVIARHLALGELAQLEPHKRERELAAADDAARGWWVGDENALQALVALPLGEARQRIVEEFERSYLRRLLARHQGNVTRAAEAAGVARRYFQLLVAKRRG
jgi:DNA-binding NtrC family response regulator